MKNANKLVKMDNHQSTIKLIELTLKRMLQAKFHEINDLK